MKIDFTYTAEIDVPIDTMVNEINDHIYDTIINSISDYNDIVGTMSNETFDKLINDNKEKIKAVILDRLSKNKKRESVMSDAEMLMMLLAKVYHRQDIVKNTPTQVEISNAYLIGEDIVFEFDEDGNLLCIGC